MPSPVILLDFSRKKPPLVEMSLVSTAFCPHHLLAHLVVKHLVKHLFTREQGLCLFCAGLPNIATIAEYKELIYTVVGCPPELNIGLNQ